MKLKTLLICFWVLWSATEIWRENGEVKFEGGLSLGSQADPFIIRPTSKSGTWWRRTGGYYDSKADCEKDVNNPAWKNQILVCLPNYQSPLS